MAIRNGRQSQLWSDLAVETPAGKSRETLTIRARRVLLSLGLSEDEIETMTSCSAGNRSRLFAAAGASAGVGFGIWFATGTALSAYEKGAEHFGEAVESAAGFLAEHWDEPVETWEIFANIAAEVMEIPGFVVKAGENLLEVVSTTDKIIDVFEKLETAGALTDVTTGFVTFMVAKKVGQWLDQYYEHFLEPHRDELARLHTAAQPLLKLREALDSRQASPAIASYLDHVDTVHWGF
jgi:hypothetical protein